MNKTQRKNRILKALESLYTIQEFHKAGLLSKEGGEYIDSEGKFCAVGCLMSGKILKAVLKGGENGDKFRTLSCGQDVVPPSGLTYTDLIRIQEYFDSSNSTWKRRLQPVKNLIAHYEAQLDNVI